MMPIHHEVGTKIVVTAEDLERMHSSNRSCVTPGYPNKAFLDKLHEDIKGEVTHTFKPGYEVTVKMEDGNSFHMKDNWFTAI
jgi:hypothetical protein